MCVCVCVCGGGGGGGGQKTHTYHTVAVSYVCTISQTYDAKLLSVSLLENIPVFLGDPVDHPDRHLHLIPANERIFF